MKGKKVLPATAYRSGLISPLSAQKKRRNAETQKRRNAETQKPRNAETQKPRNAETQKPRNPETQKPRNAETQKRRNAETQKHTEKKEEKRYRERVLTRISRKTRKDTNEFLKIQKICLRDLFFTAFCIKIRVSLCVFCVVRGKTGTQFPDGPEKSSTFVKIYLSRNVNLGNFA